jgi:hypothetical protein
MRSLGTACGLSSSGFCIRAERSCLRIVLPLGPASVAKRYCGYFAALIASTAEGYGKFLRSPSCDVNRKRKRPQVLNKLSNIKFCTAYTKGMAAVAADALFFLTHNELADKALRPLNLSRCKAHVFIFSR